jgi:hypothetical protein
MAPIWDDVVEDVRCAGHHCQLVALWQIFIVFFAGIVAFTVSQIAIQFAQIYMERYFHQSIEPSEWEKTVFFDGTPLFPERCAYTASYSLSPAEADLYQAVTTYVREEMNRADRTGDVRYRRGNCPGCGTAPIEACCKADGLRFVLDVTHDYCRRSSRCW